MRVKFSELLKVRPGSDIVRRASIDYAIAKLFGVYIDMLMYGYGGSVRDTTIQYVEMCEDLRDQISSDLSYVIPFVADMDKGLFGKLSKVKDSHVDVLLDTLARLYLYNRSRDRLVEMNAKYAFDTGDSKDLGLCKLFNHEEIMTYILTGKKSGTVAFWVEVATSRVDRVQAVDVLSGAIIGRMIGRKIEFLTDAATEKEKELNKVIYKLQNSVDTLKKLPPQVKVITIHEKAKDNTEVEQGLYTELVQSQQKNLLLEDKLAVYEFSTPHDEFEVLQELYEEEQESFDISKYKILVIGKHECKDSYPFEWIDIQGNPKAIVKVDYVDYVLFDTLCNPHHVYWAVKQRCKRMGVPLFHINNRSRDTILSETKRLIKERK